MRPFAADRQGIPVLVRGQKNRSTVQECAFRKLDTGQWNDEVGLVLEAVNLIQHVDLRLRVLDTPGILCADQHGAGGPEGWLSFQLVKLGHQVRHYENPWL